LIFRGLLIGKHAIENDNYFAGLLAYGITLMFAVQALINIGVTTGALPTKGLTLPLVSYGGSSFITACVGIAMLLRIDFETRRLAYGFH